MSFLKLIKQRVEAHNFLINQIKEGNVSYSNPQSVIEKLEFSKSELMALRNEIMEYRIGRRNA